MAGRETETQEFLPVTFESEQEARELEENYEVILDWFEPEFTAPEMAKLCQLINDEKAVQKSERLVMGECQGQFLAVAQEIFQITPSLINDQVALRQMMLMPLLEATDYFNDLLTKLGVVPNESDKSRLSQYCNVLLLFRRLAHRVVAASLDSQELPVFKVPKSVKSTMNVPPFQLALERVETGTQDFEAVELEPVDSVVPLLLLPGLVDPQPTQEFDQVASEALVTDDDSQLDHDPDPDPNPTPTETPFTGQVEVRRAVEPVVVPLAMSFSEQETNQLRTIIQTEKIGAGSEPVDLETEKEIFLEIAHQMAATASTGLFVNDILIRQVLVRPLAETEAFFHKMFLAEAEESEQAAILEHLVTFSQQLVDLRQSGLNIIYASWLAHQEVMFDVPVHPDQNSLEELEDVSEDEIPSLFFELIEKITGSDTITISSPFTMAEVKLMQELASHEAIGSSLKIHDTDHLKRMIFLHTGFVLAYDEKFFANQKLFHGVLTKMPSQVEAMLREYYDPNLETVKNIGAHSHELPKEAFYDSEAKLSIFMIHVQYLRKLLIFSALQQFVVHRSQLKGRDRIRIFVDVPDVSDE